MKPIKGKHAGSKHAGPLLGPLRQPNLPRAPPHRPTPTPPPLDSTPGLFRFPWVSGGWRGSRVVGRWLFPGSRSRGERGEALNSMKPLEGKHATFRSHPTPSLNDIRSGSTRASLTPPFPPFLPGWVIKGFRLGL